MNNGKICVSVCAETADEFIDKIKQAAELADVIELRLDCLAEDELERVELAYSENYIITFRPKGQGGNRDLALADRRDFWNTATDFCGADLEEDMIENALFRNFNPKICSHHDFSGVSKNVTEIYERLASTGADVVKMAIDTTDITDAIPVWNLLERTKPENKQIIPIAMGEAGKWTRILGLAHGAFMTYASLESGDETAPGQISAKDLIETYRVKQLDESTRVFGIIGGSTSYSMSPYIHNPAFASAKINAVFVPLQVSDLEEFMRRMVHPETREVELNFKGFSVTNPHKLAVMSYLDEIDETAQRIGAVNTIKIVNEKLYGYNTDAGGFIKPLKKTFGDLSGTRVAVFGAGGAARACIYSLKKEGADVTLFARNPKMAEPLASGFGVNYQQLRTTNNERQTPFKDFDIIVNATPLGTKGAFENETIAFAKNLPGAKLVYDLVYNPSLTRLIREAKAAGIPTIGGMEMLIAQATEQFSIWTGKDAPIDIMRAAVVERLK